MTLFCFWFALNAPTSTTEKLRRARKDASGAATSRLERYNGVDGFKSGEHIRIRSGVTVFETLIC